MATALEFEGSNCLRQRLILSTLTGKSLLISKIRLHGEEPGLNNHEISLLKLLEALTNGTTIEIDETGTSLKYIPGLLIGGKVDHDCGLGRSISYFLELVFCLAPFCKNELELTLNGITNDQLDPCVDTLKHAVLPVLRKMLRILDATEVELKVNARGFKPNGGGSVFFKCPIRRSLRPIQWKEPGKVKRIRGIAFASRVSPQMANRMVDVSKGLLLEYLPDIYIHTEHLKGKASGKSPGFGLCLVAETTGGTFYTGEAVSNPSGTELGPSVPEDIATAATHALFEEIYRGGCVDSVAQGIAALFMAFADNDLSKITFGPLSPYTIQMLRHMRDVLSLTFKLEVDEDQKNSGLKMGSSKINAACVGLGYTNLSKTIT